MGRPLLEVNKEKFEFLCLQHKTKEAICRELDVGDVRSLNKWCQREYNSSFSKVLEQKKEEENTLLIADARELAKKNSAVMIFLLKNWCGMKDNPEAQEKDEGFTKDMQAWFKKVKGEDCDNTD